MINIKKEFPWFKNNPDYIYFDSGATTLKPKIVIDAIVNYYTNWGSNPHNTDSELTYNVNLEIKKVREKVANLINCSYEEIIFCNGATEGLNLIANGVGGLLNKGDEVIITKAEHASNLLPWMRLVKTKGIKLIFLGSKNKLPTKNDFINAITNKTKVVTFSSGFNLTGHSLNENEISNAIKNINKDIIIVVDAVQSLQHRPSNTKKGSYDFLVCAAHKMFGPTGIGAIYMKQKWLKIIEPLKYGGGMNFSINENEYIMYENYMKFEAGTPNTSGILGFGAAIDFINAVGYHKINQYEEELGKYAREQLSKNPNIKIYNLNDLSSTIAINYKGIFAQDLASYLGRNKIIVRSGLSCAKLMNKVLDTEQLVRISLHIYNTKEDIDKLVDVLNKFRKEDIVNGFFE